MLRKKSSSETQAIDRVEIAMAARFNAPERLVGLGFRSWLAGYQTGDIACWEKAWTIYSNALGPKQAKPALTDLACWVRAIRKLSCRDIEIYPGQCSRFCRDECMAIAMVAASQHDACPALRACAWALLDNSAVDEVVEGAECLAARLKKCDQMLSPTTFDSVALLPQIGDPRNAV